MFDYTVAAIEKILEDIKRFGLLFGIVTLAASIVKVARWKGREEFIDPFCGSGTIAIEAAMTALNIAPGARRQFDAALWNDSFKQAFAEERAAALAAEKHEKLPAIYQAYVHGEYAYCVKKIKSMTKVDDELALIMATCSFELGKSAVLKGSLHTALRMFSDSEKYSSMTRLPTENMEALRELYKSVALNIQAPMLEFEEEKYINVFKSNYDYEFYKYVAQDYAYPFTESVYKNHVDARRMMQERKYSLALELLQSNAELIISSGYNALVLFRVYSDIELCCKEMRDFELAYKYANKRLSMLEGFKS